MCESLAEWIEEHPALAVPPPRERRQLSVYLTPDEHENLQRVFNDARLSSLWGNKYYQVVRHALHFYLPALMDLLDDGYKPISELMRADIERAGLGQTLDQINDYFATRGRELMMLIDIGEVDKAFEHYEHVIDFVHARQGIWAQLLARLLREHPDIASFRESVKRVGVLEEQRLRSIEEVMNHE